MPNAKQNQLLRVALVVFFLLPQVLVAAPGDILFSDDFEDGGLANWSTTNASASGVRNNPGYAGSGSFGAYTRNQAVTVTSPSFNAAVPEARLELWIRRGSDTFSEDTDNNEDFLLEYRRSNNTWGLLKRYAGSGIKGQIYLDAFFLPADARHANLAVRLRQTGGSGFDFDYWHFDNVRVTERSPPPLLGVGSCDDFEFGLSSNWSVNSTSGFAGISSATASSPANSMYLNGGIVSVTSNVIDTSDPSFSDLTMWIRRGADAFSEDPDFGEDLVVEYLDNVGSWIALETFTGNGTNGQTYLRTYTLPAGGRHTGFRIRYRMILGSGAAWDFWHIDDVCLIQRPFPLLQLVKTSQTISDPINGSTDPYAIPGAYVEYRVTLENQGTGQVDSDSVVITDGLPVGTALFVDASAGDPVVFVDGPTPSGLTYSFATDVTFSNQLGGGAPYDYIPNPDTDGFDASVTGLRIAPSGTMNAASGANSPSFSVTLRIRIE
jgi:uncharacterized repeat protein (TIGR01451 family)